jgi:hypothetical protein
MTTEQLLAKLSHVQAIGTRGRVWLAQCPVSVHCDTPATLQVTLVDSGFEFRCGHGCEQSAVRRALGL